MRLYVFQQASNISVSFVVNRPIKVLRDLVITVYCICGETNPPLVKKPSGLGPPCLSWAFCIITRSREAARLGFKMAVLLWHLTYIGSTTAELPVTFSDRTNPNLYLPSWRFRKLWWQLTAKNRTPEHINSFMYVRVAMCWTSSALISLGTQR